MTFHSPTILTSTKFLLQIIASLDICWLSSSGSTFQQKRRPKVPLSIRCSFIIKPDSIITFKLWREKKNTCHCQIQDCQCKSWRLHIKEKQWETVHSHQQVKYVHAKMFKKSKCILLFPANAGTVLTGKARSMALGRLNESHTCRWTGEIVDCIDIAHWLHCSYCIEISQTIKLLSAWPSTPCTKTSRAKTRLRSLRRKQGQ